MLDPHSAQRRPLRPYKNLLDRKCIFWKGIPHLFSYDLFTTYGVGKYCRSHFLDKVKVMSLLVKGLKTIRRTYTPNSRVTMVPNRSRMKPLARDRKLLRKEARVNTRENCESCWLQPERKTNKQDRGFLRCYDFVLGCFISPTKKERKKNPSKWNLIKVYYVKQVKCMNQFPTMISAE